MTNLRAWPWQPHELTPRSESAFGLVSNMEDKAELTIASDIDTYMRVHKYTGAHLPLIGM